MKQFNAKPSKYSNLGEDIKGAMRHNFDTYENPEKKAEKERVKRAKNKLKDLKTNAISSLNESNYKQVILDYEFQKALESFVNYTGPTNYTRENLLELKNHLLSMKGTGSYNPLVDKFNRLARLISRLNYRINSLDQALEHFKTKSKNMFTETNGIKRPWTLAQSFNQDSINYLATKTRAVQFGNSIPETEREYCLQNLSESIKTLENYLSFDFTTVGFSFGARGKAGSIAHYQDSEKVLAFNRGWDGALIHELGHAIDYSMSPNGRQCYSTYNLPSSIYNKYRNQLMANDIPRNSRIYYMKPTEIFARLFEVYIRATIPETTEWMQFTFDSRVMPELDAESIAWITEVLKPILKVEA